MYSIYKFTFSDGKVYIGKTGMNIEERWQHGEGYKEQEVYVPIILEGWDNIQKEILHTDLTPEQANKLEKYYIQKFNAVTNGYNRTNGGSNAELKAKLKANAAPNKNLITEISADVVKHNEDAHELWLPPLSWDKMQKVMLVLDGNEYKVYMYLLNHTNKKECFYSPIGLKREIGLSERTASNVFKRLIDYGFLVFKSEHVYQFNAYPKIVSAEPLERYK